MSNFKSWGLSLVLSFAAIGVGSIADAAPINPFQLDETQDNYWDVNDSGLGAVGFAVDDDNFVSFGIFDAEDRSNQVTIFDDSHNVGDFALFGLSLDGSVVSAVLGGALNVYANIFAGDHFGFFIETASETLYTDVDDDMESYQIYGGSNWFPAIHALTGGNSSDAGFLVVGAKPDEDFTPESSVQTVQVPEPASILMLLGGLGLMQVRRKRK